MELSEALFNLVHAVRNNMKQEIKLLNIDLSPMHLKSLKVISHIDDYLKQPRNSYLIKWSTMFQLKKLLTLFNYPKRLKLT